MGEWICYFLSVWFDSIVTFGDVSAAMFRCGPEMQGWFVALISRLVVLVVPDH